MGPTVARLAGEGEAVTEAGRRRLWVCIVRPMVDSDGGDGGRTEGRWGVIDDD
jgi:hypothetical protein